MACCNYKKNNQHKQYCSNIYRLLTGLRRAHDKQKMLCLRVVSLSTHSIPFSAWNRRKLGAVAIRLATYGSTSIAGLQSQGHPITSQSSSNPLKGMGNPVGAVRADILAVFQGMHRTLQSSCTLQ